MESNNMELEANRGATSSTAPPDVRNLVEQVPSKEGARFGRILRTDIWDKLLDRVNGTQVALARFGYRNAPF